jgi:SAM-dependent methyltransferase
LNCEDRRQKILSIVACPDCRGHLERTGERLCCKCGRSFKFDDHVPLFLASENAGYVGPEGTTNPYSPKALQLIGKYPQSLILDFGAGNPAPSEQFANVVREDFCKSPSTDIVVQTPNLPFRDEVFDHIISESVFEHVSDPLHYARELHRVLKKDGFVVIDTAFMQPVHMEFNYYNMTLDGLKETFKMFDIVESGVEPYQSASQALNIMVRTYKGLIDNASANRELSMLSSIDFAEYDQFIPADKQKLCSAGVYIIAQKR